MSDPTDSTVYRILTLMKDTFGDQFVTYFDGDPERIAKIQLPAIIVTQTTADIMEAEQHEDDITDTITVKVVLDKRDDWTGDRVDPTNLTDKRIRDYVIRRNLSTREYDDRTIVGAIRRYGVDGARINEQITAVAPTMKIEYGIMPRPVGDKKGPYVDLTSEGHVTFDIVYSLDT